MRLIGRKVYNLDSVGSTNDFAKDLVAMGEGSEGAVVIARVQTNGKGRMGRSWLSPEGGIYISLTLEPERSQCSILSVLSPLPVVWAMKRFGLEARIKWPNDLLIDGRKLGGILCEFIEQDNRPFLIVGIGINSRESIELASVPESTTIEMEVGKSVPNEEIIDALLEEYQTLYERFRKEANLRDEYELSCLTIGKWVKIGSIEGEIEGRAIRIGENGALILESDGVLREIIEGDVVEYNQER
jgi:BirA family biotin operon repressor/biotin-[acetyl-CoA-carboxylase] ligase